MTNYEAKLKKWKEFQEVKEHKTWVYQVECLAAIEWEWTWMA